MIMKNRADILKTLMTSATAKVSAFGWGIILVSLLNQQVILDLITKFIDSTNYAETIYLVLNFVVALFTQYGVTSKRRDGDNKPLIMNR